MRKRSVHQVTRGWHQGWWQGARAVPSPNVDTRPSGTDIDLVVLHSISLPPGEYGGDDVQALFTNRLNFDAHAYFDALRGMLVSAHFFVRRDGAIVQFAACDARAWHAGRSSWQGRERCNDYAIGIELEGLENTPFERAQYAALAVLLRAVRSVYPIAAVVGHEHVAPDRKHDPGDAFDWWRVKALTRWPRRLFAHALDAAAARLAGASDTVGSTRVMQHVETLPVVSCKLNEHQI